ncbi:MAG: sensor histidine kinase [Symploca sp. SIO2E9]|nr:sensor histidine kinase [Symploca sp. SIO2E9]
MRKLLPKNHPFRLLLYLEWILLGIAVLAVFSPLLVPHQPRILRLHHLRVRYPLAAAASIVTLGLMGLRLPVKSRLLPGIIYTSLGFGLSWLAVMLGGRGGSVFPALLLVVVIRGCVMFPWSGRLLVASFAYVSFLLMQLMSFLRIRPLGVSLGRPLPRVFRHMPSEFLQGIIINLTLSSALLFGLVLVFVLLLVGAVLSEHKSRQELASANQRLRQYALLIENQATLQERNRIAREIHDSVGHSLAAQSIQLENVAMLLPEDRGKLAHHLHKARQLGKEALQHVRQSVATLRNHPLQGQSLPAALAKLLKEFEATTEIQLDAKINLTSSLSAEIATALYRVTQEALTNISKHSHANEVRLHLLESSRNISLLLADNGRGFDPDENTTGFGLEGMRERAEALGGSFSLTSKPGQGCQIQVNIPLPE